MKHTYRFWDSNNSLDAVMAINKVVRRRGLRRKRTENLAPTIESTPEEKLLFTTTESQETLLTADTIAPFTFFRDTIHIDREKLTIVHRSSFRTADIMSVQIRDILSVQGKVGPLFGSLVLSSKYFINSIQTINYLRRSDVLKFQRLIQGSLIAHNENINCSGIEKEQLVTLLSDLGQGATA